MPTDLKNPLLTLALCALISTAAFAASEAPQYREFDFWLGEWDVQTGDGKLAGTNHITREYGGCVLHERYTTACGYSGESLNTYEPLPELSDAHVLVP